MMKIIAIPTILYGLEYFSFVKL